MSTPLYSLSLVSGSGWRDTANETMARISIEILPRSWLWRKEYIVRPLNSILVIAVSERWLVYTQKRNLITSPCFLYSINISSWLNIMWEPNTWNDGFCYIIWRAFRRSIIKGYYTSRPEYKPSKPLFPLWLKHTRCYIFNNIVINCLSEWSQDEKKRI